mmetsp:Transcript_1615/g.2515  ORF Transcript_1615/g.2515 Transcript_1615/m.2515 type:complete len:146 (+) Transcript_1615:111-548(+)
MGFDFENVSVVYAATEVPYLRREPTRYMEAKITQLHKHLSKKRQGDDDNATVLTVVTPTVCSNDNSWRTGSMSTISTVSSGSQATNSSLARRPSNLNLRSSASGSNEEEWGYFVDFTSKPNHKCYRSFLGREIAANKSSKKTFLT